MPKKRSSSSSSKSSETTLTNMLIENTNPDRYFEDKKEKTVSTDTLHPMIADKRTLVIVLSQAIHLSDKNLLESVFSAGSKDPELIDATVRKLETHYAIPFLRQLEAFIYESPNRLKMFIPWVNSLLVVHTSTLLTCSSENGGTLKQRLSPLLELLESRITSRQSLERLSGKLDLILDRIEMRLGSSEKSENNLAENYSTIVPLQVYSERKNASSEGEHTDEDHVLDSNSSASDDHQHDHQESSENEVNNDQEELSTDNSEDDKNDLEVDENNLASSGTEEYDDAGSGGDDEEYSSMEECDDEN